MNRPNLTRRWRIVFNIAIVLLALSGVYRLVRRALPDALHLCPDMRPTFLTARSWGEGADPYQIDQQFIQWAKVRSADEPPLPVDQARQELSLYPPGTLALFYPLTFFPWKDVRIAWLIFNLTLSILAWLALTRMMNVPLCSWQAWLFGAMSLSLGPFITSAKLGSLTLPAAMLCVLVIYLAGTRCSILAGILLGLATILKPQLAGALLVFYLLKPHIRVWVTGLGVFALLNVIGIGRLWLAHVDWLPTLRASIDSINGPGGFNDASLLNPFRWQLINLQLPLFDLFSSRAMVNGLTYLIVVLVGLIFLWAWKRSRPRSDALAAAVPLILSLLPVYHRYYDALILVIPLGWAIANLCTPRCRHAVAVLVCTLPFYVSSAYVLDGLREKGRVPALVLHSPIWKLILMPLQTWMLVAMVLVLIHAIARGMSDPPESVGSIAERNQ